MFNIFKKKEKVFDISLNISTLECISDYLQETFDKFNIKSYPNDIIYWKLCPLEKSNHKQIGSVRVDISPKCDSSEIVKLITEIKKMQFIIEKRSNKNICIKWGMYEYEKAPLQGVICTYIDILVEN